MRGARAWTSRRWSTGSRPTSGTIPRSEAKPGHHRGLRAALRSLAAGVPSHLFVFAEVLRRKLASQRDDPLDYPKERILDRIGLAVADWDRDDAGHPDGAFGAELTAREWAKLGILLKNRGVRGG